MSKVTNVELVPAVRDRISERLIAMGVPSGKAVSHVAGITGRAEQTVRRWFDPKFPGLPDLRSFARLCAGLDLSADEMIGLSAHGLRSARPYKSQLLTLATSVMAMANALERRHSQGEPLRVTGDEMEPKLYEGDLVFIDRDVDHLVGNGIYVLECDGRIIIRRVERRMGQGLVLKCDNKAYRDWELKSPAAARRMGVKIVGRVHGAIGMRLF